MRRFGVLGLVTVITLIVASSCLAESARVPAWGCDFDKDAIRSYAGAHGWQETYETLKTRYAIIGEDAIAILCPPAIWWTESRLQADQCFEDENWTDKYYAVYDGSGLVAQVMLVSTLNPDNIDLNKLQFFM